MATTTTSARPSEISVRVLEQCRAAYCLRTPDAATRVSRALYAVGMPLQQLLKDGYTPSLLAESATEDQQWAMDTVHALGKAAAFTDECLAVAFDKLQQVE